MRQSSVLTLPAVDRFIEDNGSRIFKTEPEEVPFCTWLELVPDVSSPAPDDENSWPGMEA